MAHLIATPALLVLTLLVAQRAYRIPYDYVRIAKPLVIALGLSLARGYVPSGPLTAAIAVKALLFLAYPVALVASGFVTAGERLALRGVARRYPAGVPARERGGTR